MDNDILKIFKQEAIIATAKAAGAVQAYNILCETLSRRELNELGISRGVDITVSYISGDFRYRFVKIYMGYNYNGIDGMRIPTLSGFKYLKNGKLSKQEDDICDMSYISQVKSMA